MVKAYKKKIYEPSEEVIHLISKDPDKFILIMGRIEVAVKKVKITDLSCSLLSKLK